MLRIVLSLWFLCFACSANANDLPFRSSLRLVGVGAGGRSLVGSAVAVELESVSPGSVGWALTAKHAIEPWVRYHVERFDWSNGVPGARHKYPATVYCMSETHDVALLAVQESATGGPLPSVKMVPAEFEPESGVQLLTVGAPLGGILSPRLAEPLALTTMVESGRAYNMLDEQPA